MEQTRSELDALSSGRRIYLGNLPYNAKPYDIATLLGENGFNELEHIHISVDPVSARNPGYCFVDFNDRETADRALSGLKASINGRPVKVGPCQPKKQNKPRWFNEDDPVNKRWGDWSSKNGNYVSTDQTQRGPNWALDHFEDMVDNLGGRRLYVGGLDMMVNQALHNTEMTELFAEFCPTAIGKRITPHESQRSRAGNHHYCFVDFATKEQATRAKNALDGQPFGEDNLKVSFAKRIPKKLVGRHTVNRESHSGHDEKAFYRSSNPSSENRAQESNNWRNKS